ncbi:MAG: insulinase family protein [Pirellulaceae bacterium]
MQDWSSDIPYQRIDRPAHPDLPGQVDTIVTPDKANAVYYAGQQYDMSDTDPDYAAMVIGNYILGAGGRLSSRLGDRVRQQEGLSYGIRSGFSVSTKDNRGEFTIFAITNPDNKDKLMKVIREEIDRLLADGITEDELAKAKEGYLQREAVRRSDDSYIVSQLVLNMFTDRTMQFTEQQEKEIANLTIDQVNAALRKYIDPERLIVSVAGDFKMP